MAESGCIYAPAPVWRHLSPIPDHALQADFDCSGLPEAARTVRSGDVDGDGLAEVVIQIDAAHSGGNDFWVMKFNPVAGSWQHLSPIPGHALQADFDCSGLPNAGRSSASATSMVTAEPRSSSRSMRPTRAGMIFGS